MSPKYLFTRLTHTLLVHTLADVSDPEFLKVMLTAVQDVVQARAEAESSRGGDDGESIVTVEEDGAG